MEEPEQIRRKKTMEINNVDTFYPKTKQEWRNWLEENHLTKTSVWLIQYNKKSNKPSIGWSDAVDEALCFGWIDSIRKKLDDDSTIQFFSKRKDKSTWSKINKQKVEKFTELNLMAPAGLERINIAKLNGCWELLDSVEALIIPDDLEEALRSKDGALEFFQNLSKSKQKAALHRLVMARTKETREKRLKEILELCEKGQQK